MLVDLAQENVEVLSKALQGLSDKDKALFHPHKFDIESVKNLLREQGNRYYIYQDESGRFAGYGMLRTFGKYSIPTLGCVIWEMYRGQGNGKKLVEQLIDKAKELKYQKISLKVYPSNKIAHDLYRKTGFKKISESEDGQIRMEYVLK
jgi:ribosomal protein S18 acetylase RimI-like enzyme